MGRDQDAATLGSELGEERLEEVGARPVDSGERLVEEEGRRVLDERARDEHALALAARELAELAVGEGGESDPLERGSGKTALGAPREPPPRHTGERPHQRDVESGDRVVEP